MMDLVQEVAGNNLAVADMEITTDDEMDKAGGALNRMKEQPEGNHSIHRRHCRTRGQCQRRNFFLGDSASPKR